MTKSAFRLEAITPKVDWKPKDIERAIEKAVHKTANLVLQDYKAVARTWDHKPAFDLVIQESDGAYSITAGTDDEIFGYVDRGTKPHIIRPRKARLLKFRGGYRAKTRPGVIGSNAGGAAGGSFTSAYFVLHPGTQKRGFTEAIRKRREKTLEQEARQNIAKVLRKS